MVRIKHRYLLFNILYPPASPPSLKPTDSDSPPYYVLFSRASPSHLNASLVSTLVRAEIHTLFGDHGLSVTQSSLRVVYFSPTTSTGILRVPRAHFRMVWAALSFVTGIPGDRERGGRGGRDGRSRQPVETNITPCVIRVVRVSGTIRKSEEELLRRARREVVRAKVEGRSTGEDEEPLRIFSEKEKQKSTLTSLTDAEEEGIIDADEEDEAIDMSD
ncbi:RNA-binding protein pop5 [Cladophialophora chaetospira]|uniref:Ribonuclease P/MRP protein subunit POP5 n=1 Tax=Cladophialophora chaetospira TaxID=386627 RepID=A0AA38XGI4_9EURO|nr:RNA-binding protein pop5 [Cladophialophora chaetospira]